jgi:prevent-host-death family protein
MKDAAAKNTASVVQLKARLSEYLRRVKAGNELVVTERGLPIARIVPLEAAERRATRDERLIRAGLMRPGRHGGRVSKALLKRLPPSGPSLGVLDALLANREEDER